MAPEASSQSRSRVGRALLPLGLLFLAVGISIALYFPFLSLFLSTDVAAGPVRITFFLIAAPLAGVLGSVLVGRVSDRLPIRRRLLIGGGGGRAGWTRSPLRPSAPRTPRSTTAPTHQGGRCGSPPPPSPCSRRR